MRIIFHIIVFLQLCLFSISDQQNYIDSNGANIDNIFLELEISPIVELEIFTSNTYLAGTVDDVFATFIGEFSMSGPHNIGKFAQGSKRIQTITLDRVIGELNSILLEKIGSDSWLLTTLDCRIGDIKFQLKGKRQWLDALDPLTEKLYSNGYEPNSQDLEIPSAATLLLSVSDKIKLFQPSGAY